MQSASTAKKTSLLPITGEDYSAAINATESLALLLNQHRMPKKKRIRKGIKLGRNSKKQRIQYDARGLCADCARIVRGHSKQ